MSEAKSSAAAVTLRQNTNQATSAKKKQRKHALGVTVAALPFPRRTVDDARERERRGKLERNLIVHLDTTLHHLRFAQWRAQFPGVADDVLLKVRSGDSLKRVIAVRNCANTRAVGDLEGAQYCRTVRQALRRQASELAAQVL